VRFGRVDVRHRAFPFAWAYRHRPVDRRRCHLRGCGALRAIARGGAAAPGGACPAGAAAAGRLVARRARPLMRRGRFDMRKAALGLMVAGLAWGVAPAQQPYPSRPVTLIVPFGAGGPTDALARILSDAMRVSLGQSVVVENVTGASGTLGVGRAARAAPDGYTVSIGNWGSHIVNGAIYALPYDLERDFEPVARLSANPYVIVARKDLPAGDLKELVAWLKANPDKATEGTAGSGSGQHVSGVYFQNVTGARFQFVPYRAGSSEIIRDLVAGHIDFTFDQVITALPHVRNGSVKAYAVTSSNRLAAAPDIPSVDEAGAPGVYVSTWYGRGCRKARRPRPCDGSPPRQWLRLPIRRCASGSRASARRFRRPSSRPRRRSPRTRGPRSRSGGP